ncbi:TMCO4 family protein [Vibrio alginolyticus]|uniref:TMCO4 family protein n=1 Tax=Vibrio alginolyticus TaxID=663 RepID=UPI00215D4C4B|nr:TMCO4 family protein [Vibrio alginolyticus]MCR9594277.1 TMCO4 family protein [Vibrio alginolyticus]
MATHKPYQLEDKGFIDDISQSWASECCAEHDGAIANFYSLNEQLNCLTEFECLFRNKKINFAAGGKILGGMVAGVAVFGPLSYVAAPAIASSLGSLGLLGAASTGTAISTLSGAALTSASLAALGPGGMAGGVAFVSAIGGALGGTKGAVVSNNYFGAIDDFNIIQVREGTGPAIIFINGFLSQKEKSARDWLKGIERKYPDNPCYLVTWESSSLLELGKFVKSGATAVKKSIEDSFILAAKRATKKAAQKIGPLNWASFLADLIGNPWHTSMAKASMTGILLADIIARTKNDDGYILMGHSLGCRVIYYCLEALSSKPEIFIKDVYLFGGAVSSKASDWESALSAVEGKITNHHSDNDDVLKYLYRAANIGLSEEPIGISLIDESRVNNENATNLVSGHMKYKDNLFSILN